MEASATLRAVATEAAQRVKEVSIAVLGDLILDAAVEGDHGGIHPETEVPLLKNASSQQSLGGAGNIALVLSRLGVGAPLFSIVGADLPGRQLTETQDRLQMASYLVTCRDWPTPQKHWIYERAGAALQMIQRIDFDRPLPRAAREQLLGEFRIRYRRKTKVLIVADHGLGVMGAETAEAIGIAQQGGSKVVAIPRTPLETYQSVNVLVSNPTEMREISGLKGKGEAQGAAIRFAEKYGVTIFLTQGSRGLFVCAPAEEIKQLVPTTEIEYPQKMGARDMILAVVAWGAALNLPVLSIAELANAFSYLVVQQRGNGLVTWSDLFHAYGMAQPAQRSA